MKVVKRTPQLRMLRRIAELNREGVYPSSRALVRGSHFGVLAGQRSSVIRKLSASGVIEYTWAHRVSVVDGNRDSGWCVTPRGHGLLRDLTS